MGNVSMCPEGESPRTGRSENDSLEIHLPHPKRSFPAPQGLKPGGPVEFESLPNLDLNRKINEA